MSDYTEIAEALLNLLESDFGQSGRDVRVEAIKCELERMHHMGYKQGQKEARDK